jgi:hypothetical protein
MVSGKQIHPFMTPETKQTLLHKLNTHSATVAVIGLGYVGLPLAVAFAESGFPVTFGCAQCRRRHRRRPQQGGRHP